MPQHFFDILYQNDSLFGDQHDTVELLYTIDFKKNYEREY